jgi:hypothetical protein
MAGDPGGRWIRIPLIGDTEGVVVLLPDEPFTEENWQVFISCLDAMRPGLVDTRTKEALHDQP